MNGAEALSKSAARHRSVMQMAEHSPQTWHEALRAFETAWFTKLLQEHGGRVYIAAGFAGLSENSIYRHLRKLGLIPASMKRKGRT